jgi:hypothetical protein
MLAAGEERGRAGEGEQDGARRKEPWRRGGSFRALQRRRRLVAGRRRRRRTESVQVKHLRTVGRGKDTPCQMHSFVTAPTNLEAAIGAGGGQGAVWSRARLNLRKVGGMPAREQPQNLPWDAAPSTLTSTLGLCVSYASSTVKSPHKLGSLQAFENPSLR